jgi:uncharacterized zinc-type alcohol dehydrogenase-like protein
MCREGLTMTYGSPDRITREITHGGYSKHVVVRQEFVLHVPEALDLARAAPLLCAGSRPIRRCAPGMSARAAVSA